MTKRPPQKGPPPALARAPATPTVAVPGSATGFRATVPLPGARQGVAQRPPGQADILNALRAAAAHLGAKRYGPAAALAEQILKFVPKQPDALHLRGLVAFETGNFAEAERLITLAVAAAGNPSANMLVNCGNAQREQGKLSDALAFYARALKVDPLYSDAFFERGILKIYERGYQAALAEFDRAIELRPDVAAAYARATEAAMELGQFREALNYCEQAIKRMPAPPAVIFALKANIHERLSELDAALLDAERALAIDPGHGEAMRVWARAQRRLKSGDAGVLDRARKRLQAIDTSKLPFDQKRGIHEELAQLSDKLGDYDDAFAQFIAMNEEADREAAMRNVDKTSYLAQVDALTGAFTRDWTSSWSELPACGIERGHRAEPVFLVGFPRSGTTLLDQIIDAHPDFQVIEEKPLIRVVRDAAQALGGGYPASLATLTAETREGLRQSYWAALAAEGADMAGKIVVDKMPLNLIHAGLIARVFPEARIILALRHPADSVLSCFMQNFQLNGSMVNFHSLEDAARLYDRVMTLWQAYVRLLSLRVCEVRYEHLISDLRGEVEPLLHFLGAEWHEAQADPAAHALARGTIRTPSYAQVTQPIYSSAANRWRRYEKHLAPALPVLEKHIRHFGYEL